MSAYTYELQSTAGPHNPDEPEPRRMGVGMASSTIWCRVTRTSEGIETTGWVEAKGVPSIIKARAMFNRAENMRAAGFNFVPMAWALVTLTEWPAHMSLT